MKDKVRDELAQDLFSIQRNLGSRFQSLNKIKNLENSNDYLNHQFDRLRKYAQEGQIEKFDFLAKILLKNSKVFLLYGFNHAYESHASARATKIIKTLKKVIRLAIDEVCELSYKRVWIDKKPGDYGRPLGVPEMAHRIYGHMFTRLMEAYLCGTDQYSPSQHGGTPGRGVQTYLIELAKRFPQSKHIFEFDIKGYFDHIDHSAILKLFKSTVILKYLKGALNSDPTSYNLPPEDLDQAVKNYEDLRHWACKALEPWKNSSNYNLYVEDYIADCMREEFGRGEIPSLHFPDSERLDSMYKDLMEKSNFYPTRTRYGVTKYLEHNEHEREIGRDNWKDLNLKDKGVPQGSSFGPVLSSVLLGKIMPKDSLLYMDDGIIFLGDKRTTKQAMIRRVNKVLQKIGCELNIKKSNLLTSSVLIRQGFKILGTRIKRSYFNHSQMSIQSETRKGISKPFFPKDETSITNLLLELYRRKYITVSKRRVLDWYIKNGKLEFLDNSTLIKMADKIGILGAIINRAYSPTTSLEEMKEMIEYGIFKAEMKINASKGSMGERLINHTKVIIVEGTEERVNVKPNLYIVRALANDVLLRYLKGELPARTMRVQGMRKTFKSPKQSKTVRSNTEK